MGRVGIGNDTIGVDLLDTMRNCLNQVAQTFFAFSMVGRGLPSFQDLHLQLFVGFDQIHSSFLDASLQLVAGVVQGHIDFTMLQHGTAGLEQDDRHGNHHDQCDEPQNQVAAVQEHIQRLLGIGNIEIKRHRP